MNAQARSEPMPTHPVPVLEAFDVLVDLVERGIGAQESDEVKVIAKEARRHPPDEDRHGNGVPVQPPPEQRAFKTRFLAMHMPAEGGSERRSCYHLGGNVVPMPNQR